jgi:phosphoglucosamine mutase
LPLKFGTDGLRGVANAELTPEMALALGRAVARVMDAPRFLVGRDTRLSGPMLASALAAGLASEGVEVVDVEVIPTPGLAWLCSSRRCPGAMVSASHNPFPDNGIKIFAAGGTKLDDRTEAALEAEMASILDTGRGQPGGRLAGEAVGSVRGEPEARSGYEQHLIDALGGRRLDGCQVVLDCSHGAAVAVAPSVFRALGAEVGVIAAEPDGTNINDSCGSTHPERLQHEVLAAGAHVGLAFDGDADRVIAVDENGALVDGDQLMALFALDLKEQGELAEESVVVTVMTNLGFHHAMRDSRITVRQTKVGDRYVLEEIEQAGLSLGGEQSGHIIFRRLATTGDGVLTGLLLVDLLVRRSKSLGELASAAMTRLPQTLVNVSVADPARLDRARRVWEEVSAVESDLEGEGRVLLRASGTEPLVRVMVEASSPERAEKVADRLRRVVEQELAGPDPAEPGRQPGETVKGA